MNRSKFQFSNPELEKIEFLVNHNFNEEKYHGIAMQSNTQVELLEGDEEAVVKLTLIIGNAIDFLLYS